MSLFVGRTNNNNHDDTGCCSSALQRLSRRWRHTVHCGFPKILSTDKGQRPDRMLDEFVRRPKPCETYPQSVQQRWVRTRLFDYPTWAPQ